MELAMNEKPTGIPKKKNEKSTGIPKKKSVILLFLLCTLTLGIYSFVWYIKRSDELNNLRTTTKSKKGLAKFALFLQSLYFFVIPAIGILVVFNTIKSFIQSPGNFTNIPITFTILLGIETLLSPLIIIFSLVLAFKVRKILNEALVNKAIKRKVSGLYTFFFNFLYLQYEINRIIKDTENKKRIGPLLWFLACYVLPFLAYGGYMIYNLI